MKFKIFFFLILSSQSISAQLFSEHPYAVPFDPVNNSSITFGDVDGDGDEDVLVTGINHTTNRISTLYLNDGEGNFTERVDTPFEGVSNGSAAFADVDNDNDQDLIIIGNNNGSHAILYINDGTGNFEEKANTPFEGVGIGTVAFSDVDGDGDEDVFIAGKPSSNFAVPSSKLYINDGQGNFTEMMNTSFEPIEKPSVAFFDIDGDDDMDLLLTEFLDANNSSFTGLYINDGQGNFTEALDNPFGLFIRSIDYFDIDGDNDLDLLITKSTTSLFINDGQGNFTELLDTPFFGVLGGSASVFFDLEGDNDQDIFIAGNNSNGNISKVFRNDGQNNFTEVLDNPFEGIFIQSIDFSDVDNDNDNDLLMVGTKDGGNNFISRLYINNGEGSFKNAVPFHDVSDCSITFADIDGDSDEDVLITGNTATESNMSNISGEIILYTNDGQGNFTPVPNTPFEAVKKGDVAFADVDNDNDLDVLISGNVSSQNNISKLYLNDSQGNFTEALNTPFEGVMYSSVAFVDVDGDGDQDIFIKGYNNIDDINFARLYTNDGQGSFTEVTGTPFSVSYRDPFAFVDVDGDDDQDLLTTEPAPGTGPNTITKLYLNDGQGNFTEKLGTSFMENVSNGSIIFSDVDGDLDQDVLISGGVPAEKFSTLYLNDGQGNFIQKLGTPFEGVNFGSSAFKDVDGDNDEDLLLTGVGNFSNIIKLYLNDGQGNFVEMIDVPFYPVWESSIAFSDIDADNDYDVLIAGRSAFNRILTKLYRNEFSFDRPKISSQCYYDRNENQIKDADEINLLNQLVQITPTSTISYPTIDGKHNFYIENGMYQLTSVPIDNWELTTEDTIDVNYIGTPITDINFGFIPTTELQLIEPDISSGPTRCSFDVPFWIKNQNTGTTYETGFLEFTMAEGTTLQNIEPAPDIIVNNKLIWNFTSLAPTRQEDFYMTLKMPDATNIGDTLNFVATIFLISDNQDTIQNTVYNYNPVLNCAYDPNDKAVIPVGVGNDQLTLFDTELEYKIRFQNTGTDTAFTVRIEDDLDSELDWSTFRPISASHPYEVDMDVEAGRVTFLFRNILLPDSTTNEVLSHGFVKYKIFPLSNLPEGTPITNEASIFFDFNEPIITNTTLNRLVSDLTNTEETSFSTELAVIPNPFQKSTIFRIKDIPGNRGSLNIYDTNGVLVFSETVASNTDVTYRKEGLASGIYFYEVVDQKSVRVFGGKVVKY